MPSSSSKKTGRKSRSVPSEDKANKSSGAKPATHTTTTVSKDGKQTTTRTTYQTAAPTKGGSGTVRSREGVEYRSYGSVSSAGAPSTTYGQGVTTYTSSYGGNNAAYANPSALRSYNNSYSHNANEQRSALATHNRVASTGSGKQHGQWSTTTYQSHGNLNTSQYVNSRSRSVQQYDDDNESNVTVGHLSGTIYPIRQTDTEQGIRTVASRSILRKFEDRANERLISTVEIAGGTETREYESKTIVKVPKKVVREEIVERIFVVPETITIEVFEEDDIEVDEKIVETIRDIIIEKIVEIPEIEEVEVIIEEEIINLKERIVEVEKIIPVVKEVIKQVMQPYETIVEVEQREKVDVPYVFSNPREAKVSVPLETQVITARRVDAVVEKEEVQVVTIDRDVMTPIAVEAITTVEFNLPAVVSREVKKKYPVYMPRFIEVPVSRQFATPEFIRQQEKGGLFSHHSVSEKLHSMMANESLSLCEIEKFATSQLEAHKEIGIAHDKTRRDGILRTDWRSILAAGQHESYFNEMQQQPELIHTNHQARSAYLPDARKRSTHSRHTSVSHSYVSNIPSYFPASTTTIA